MAIKNITLTPAGEDDRIVFKGTNAAERVSFSNPDGFYFGADLDLAGGNDILVNTDPRLNSGTIVAGSGNDKVITAAEFSLSLDGGSGNDTLDGAADFGVRLLGGAGGDRLEGRSIDHVLADAGIGDDTITGASRGLFEADAGDGDDTIDVRDSGGSRLDGGAGNDLIAFATFDYTEHEAYGGSGNDTIRYRASPYEEIGPEATFDLYGGPGRDRIHAGDGSDTVHVTAANSPAGGGRDVVYGFGGGGTDLLSLLGDADRSKAGEQDYAFVGETRAAKAGQVGYYESGGDTVVRGFDGRTAFEVQLEGYRGGLGAGDFVL